MPVGRSLRRALACLAAPAAALAASLASAPPAQAAPCPGAEPGAPCPHGGVLVIGESAEGVLRFPQALALSPDGARVYVADQQSSRVQAFTRDGVAVARWGRHGAGPGELRRIGGLATDAAGRVHVLDSDGDRVQVFSPAGELLGAWGATGTEPGRFDLGSNGGLAVLGDEAWVADQNNHRVQVLELDPATGLADTDPEHVRTFGMYGDCVGDCPPLALNRPQGIAVRATPEGGREVFVADEHHHRVVKLDGAGAALGTVGAPGELGYPYDVAVDARGRLYVADNCDPGFRGCRYTEQDGRVDLTHQRVMAYDAGSLAFLETWGVFGGGPGQFQFPRALAAVTADPRGGVLVADAGNNRVQVFAADGTFERQWGVSGRGPGFFTRPAAVAAAPGGEVVVADTGTDRVQVLDAAGRYLGEWGRRGRTGHPRDGTGPGEFDAPAGIVVADDGTLYVADTDNARVQARDPAGTWRVLEGAPVRTPRGLALDLDGRLVVADPAAQAVHVHDPASGAWSTVDGPFVRPQAVAVDDEGTLFVADAGADAVLRRRAGGERWRALGTGELQDPAGVAVTPEGALLASDTGGDRIVRLTRGGAVRASWGARGTGAGELVGPAGLAVDAGGRVLVADDRNHRIQAFAPPRARRVAHASSAPPPPARPREAPGLGVGAR